MQALHTFTNKPIVQKHGLKLVWAIAILCLCWMLIHAGMTIKTFSETRVANYQAQQIAPIRKSNKAPYQVRQITNAHLFGDPKPKPKVVKKAPKTTLDLTLQGILWASDNSIARAIIQRGNSQSKLYSIGEKIEGASAKISEIRAGEVILNRNGAAESLPLIKATKSGNGNDILTFSEVDNVDIIADSLDSHEFFDSHDDDPSTQPPSASSRAARRNLSRPNVKAQSPNGAPRKVRKPNFSGLDRALKKLGEI